MYHLCRVETSSKTVTSLDSNEKIADLQAQTVSPMWRVLILQICRF